MTHEWEAMQRGERPIADHHSETEVLPHHANEFTENETLYPAYNGFNHGDVPADNGGLNKQSLILILTSFLIPGLGLAADGCMTRIISAIASLGNAVKVISKHCERIQCPNCYSWWISQRAFKLAVLIECYAKFKKERPAGVVCSVHPDEVKSWTWKDYGNFIRKCYSRMYKLGITGGVRVFHPFRVREEARYEFRKMGANDSGGFWKMIRENVLNYSSWYAYVYLAPHIHALVFPSFLDENKTSDIIIKKYAVFDTVRDTVAHVRYLLSHCGVLTDGENEPASVFGVLHGWKPSDHLSHDEILSIKREVADTMGLVYDEENDDIKPIDIDKDKDEKYDWIPIYKFGDYSRDQIEFITNWLSTVKNPNFVEFVGDIINLYNDRRSDHNRLKNMRNVLLEDLGDIPEGFEVVEE